MRRIPILLVGIAVVSVTLLAQTPASPSFEVVSIKPNPGANFASMSFQGGRLVMVNQPVASLITFAYPTDVPELVGAPAWVNVDKFDVTAKAPVPNPTRDEMAQMTRTLLAERFKLMIHDEVREHPVYALVVAREDGRLGPQIHASTVDCDAVAAALRSGAPQDGSLSADAASCRSSMSPGKRLYGGVQMSVFARSITVSAGRIVIDKTGLTGRYNITLLGTFGGRLPSADQPSFVTALQEQLGLKLVSDRTPLRMLVIDRIERPTEN